MNIPQSLCPGYKQVEEFGPDDEYEDEEVSFVTLDLGNVEPTLVPSASSYHLIGLDSPTPFLQLQGTVLKGRHNQLLGTELIFTDDKELYEWNKRSVHHVANTEQRILFKEVTLQPRSRSPSPEAQKTSEPLEKGGTGQADLDSVLSGTTVDVDAQRIDRMTGKAAPLARAPRPKGSSKGTAKRKAEAPDAPAPKPSKRKGKEKADTVTTDQEVDEGPTEVDRQNAMDTTEG